MSTECSGQRIALSVEYNGAAYSGWQAQRDPHQPTVQETLESAIAGVADHSITTVCAGRTDTGVHGCAQVVHFETSSERPLRAWTLGVNAKLPADVSVRWAHLVSDDFHARFSATYRRYRYVILNREQRSANAAGAAVVVRRSLNVERMHSEAQALVGEHDFSSFRAAGCQSRTPWRRVEAISVKRCADLIVIDIQANAFVHHMVRNIAGSLIAVGDDSKADGWISALLAMRDRREAAATAPAHGLYLVDVGYPERFGLPRFSIGPWFLGLMS